jgi:hypothetical protein
MSRAEHDGAYARREARARAFLAEHGAQTIAHPGGTLYEHLARTAERLRGWGAREDLVLAGLCHATYGTDGFDRSLLPHSSREPLEEIIGSAAEAIVYAYAGCERDRTYADLAAGRPLLHDRFAGTSRPLDRGGIADFVELTFANELDVMRQSAELRKAFGPNVAALFAALTDYASDGARAAFENELGDLVLPKARPL